MSLPTHIHTLRVCVCVRVWRYTGMAVYIQYLHKQYPLSKGLSKTIKLVQRFQAIYRGDINFIIHMCSIYCIQYGGYRIV